MSEEEPQLGFLDRAVETLANAMNAVGLNGTRLQWKWRQRKLRQGEEGLQREIFWRSAKGKHKMCRSCRALVDRGASQCPDCGASMSGVQAPGIGRAISNAMPGLSNATSLIMLVNGALFVLMLMWPSGGDGQVTGFGRLMRFDGYTTLRFGCGHGYLFLEDGEWFRVITANFLHGGLIHFGFNSFVLMQLGPLVEQVYGTYRFWVIYLLSGTSGMLVATLMPGKWGTTVVGASAALCGLVGLLLAYGMREKGGAAEGIKRSMMQYSLMILIISFFPGISFLGHAGGFAAGFALGYLVPTQRLDADRATGVWQIASLVGVLLVLYSFYQVALRGQDFARYLN